MGSKGVKFPACPAPNRPDRAKLIRSPPVSVPHAAVREGAVLLRAHPGQIPIENSIGPLYKKIMRFDPEKHHRKSIRLKGHNYARPGMYFVTVCTHKRVCLFGHVAEKTMVLNDAGRMVQDVWNALPVHYPHVCLDEMVIMPDHIHGIIILTDENQSNQLNMPNIVVVGAGFKPAPTTPATAQPAPTPTPASPPAWIVTRHGLPEIVRGFKTFSSRRINIWRNTTGCPVWQRNYHEHIIRNEQELFRIRKYIRMNPAKWHIDLIPWQ